MSPTERSLKYYRDQGYLVAVVEKFVRFPPPGHRVDLWGFADLIGVRGSPECPRLLVQVTSGDNLAHRRTKMAENQNIRTCMQAGFKVEIHGWTKKKLKRGGKAFHYVLKREEVTNG